MSWVPQVHHRDEWGATPWRGSTYHIDIAARDYLFTHYYGYEMPERYRVGEAMARHVESIHLRKGWAGVGYGLMVDLVGEVFVGRGWELVGAHCPNFNTRGMSIFFACGGSQPLSHAQQRTGRYLYDQYKAMRQGRVHHLVTHGDKYPTSCAGPVITPWTHADMPLRDVAPVPVIPKPAPLPIPKLRLNVDGQLGPNTIRALQERLRASGRGGLDRKLLVVDGVNGPNTTAALQRYLNMKLSGRDLVVDGLGFAQKNNYVTNTHKALQRWLGVHPDGQLDHPVSYTVKRMQDRLNRGNF